MSCLAVQLELFCRLIFIEQCKVNYLVHKLGISFPKNSQSGVIKPSLHARGVYPQDVQFSHPSCHWHECHFQCYQFKINIMKNLREPQEKPHQKKSSQLKYVNGKDFQEPFSPLMNNRTEMIFSEPKNMLSWNHLFIFIYFFQLCLCLRGN